MASSFSEIKVRLLKSPHNWAVTGVAGFIGSNLLEFLLSHDQVVVGLDNLSSGYMSNLEAVEKRVTQEQWSRFRFLKGDIRSVEDCKHAVDGVEYVLHQAALGSVPASIDDPVLANDVNAGGFVNMLKASVDAQVKRMVYASSSAVYGDSARIPSTESEIGNCLSPYAVTKRVNELYSEVFYRNYGFRSVGLRYFNIFGNRQDPNGAYAAVIPRWFSAMAEQQDVYIFGDGETSRDFCPVENVVQANVLSALAPESDLKESVYNVALGAQTTLNQLFNSIRMSLLQKGVEYIKEPIYAPSREGDVRFSQASIDRITDQLGYGGCKTFQEGLDDMDITHLFK